MLCAGGRRAPLDRKLATYAVWAGTAAPIGWWHAHLPTRFAWFMEGDLITGVPPWGGTAALLAEVPVWAAFGARRLDGWRRGRPNPMVPPQPPQLAAQLGSSRSPP